MSFKYLLGRMRSLYLLYYVGSFNACTELGTGVPCVHQTALQAAVLPHLSGTCEVGLPVGGLGRGHGLPVTLRDFISLGGPLALFSVLNMAFS